MVFKKCVATCQTYGYDKKTMIKCGGYHNSYHYKCLQKRTCIAKKDLERQQNELMCNIGQPCLYLRIQNLSKNG